MLARGQRSTDSIGAGGTGPPDFGHAGEQGRGRTNPLNTGCPEGHPGSQVVSSPANVALPQGGWQSPYTEARSAVRTVATSAARLPVWQGRWEGAARVQTASKGPWVENPDAPGAVVTLTFALTYIHRGRLGLKSACNG